MSSNVGQWRLSSIYFYLFSLHALKRPRYNKMIQYKSNITPIPEIVELLKLICSIASCLFGQVLPGTTFCPWPNSNITSQLKNDTTSVSLNQIIIVYPGPGGCHVIITSGTTLHLAFYLICIKVSFILQFWFYKNVQNFRN